MAKKKEETKQEVKVVSELKFSDFTGSEFKYDHEKENAWEAMGATDKDEEQIKEKMLLGIFAKEEYNTLSKKIEGALKLDIPAPWKAYAFMKLGSVAVQGRLLEIVMEAPDNIPVPMLKGLLSIAIAKSGV